MIALLLIFVSLVGAIQLPSDQVPGGSTNAATFTLHSLVFDAPTNVSSYRIYVTPIIARPSAVDVATNWISNSRTNDIRHLLYGQTYWIQARSIIGTNESDLSAVLVWPQTLTNVGYLKMYQSDRVTGGWQSFGPQVVVTNPLGFYRIEGTVTNNIDPFQIPE